MSQEVVKCKSCSPTVSVDEAGASLEQMQMQQLSQDMHGSLTFSLHNENDARIGSVLALFHDKKVRLVNTGRVLHYALDNKFRSGQTGFRIWSSPQRLRHCFSRTSCPWSAHISITRPSRWKCPVKDREPRGPGNPKREWDLTQAVPKERLVASAGGPSTIHYVRWCESVPSSLPP